MLILTLAPKMKMMMKVIGNHYTQQVKYHKKATLNPVILNGKISVILLLGTRHSSLMMVRVKETVCKVVLVIAG